MRRLVGGYASEFNRRHDRYGDLFGGPCTASLFATETYAIQVCAYVVLNPVRAGLVNDPADWSWSSYRASAGLVKIPSFIETRLVPSMLHPDVHRAQEPYREHVHEVGEHPKPGSG